MFEPVLAKNYSELETLRWRLKKLYKLQIKRKPYLTYNETKTQRESVTKQASGQKQTHCLKGVIIRLTADFSTKIIEIRRQ